MATAALLLAGTVAALEVPPTPTDYLTDLAGVVPQGQVAAIDRRLHDVEQRTGHQIIAVLFPALGGEPLEDFTIRCAERWKVGRKGLDDGAIFFAFIRDRRMRLEVGYGLEDKIPDALAGRLLDDFVKPAFARGDYGGGVAALAGALDATFRGEPLRPVRARSGGAPSLGLVVLIVAALLLRALLSGSRRWRGPGGWYGGGFGGFSGGGGGFGGGGFSAGGGSFGGGGASGSW